MLVECFAKEEYTHIHYQSMNILLMLSNFFLLLLWLR